MRTSLNRVKQIEDHLFGYAAPGDALVFEAWMILDDSLREQVSRQQNTYDVVQQYGRNKLKAEITAVQQKLMADPQHRGFIQKIMNLFKNRRT